MKYQKFKLTILHTEYDWYTQAASNLSLRSSLDNDWIRVNRKVYGATAKHDQTIEREVRTKDVRAFEEV